MTPGAPADIVKALVDQDQSPPGAGTSSAEARIQGQLVEGALKGESRALVLHLPDQPESTLNSAHPQTFGGV